MFMKRVVAAFRLRDWAGVAIEFAIVVIGIFVALQVDDWNQQRTNRQLERVYIARLIVETRANLGDLEDVELIYQDKIRFILALPDMPLGERVPKDPQDFMRHVDNSSFIAIPSMRSSTYDELQSSGRLSLIRDTRLRSAVANNLNAYESTRVVLDQPIGEYRRVLFETLAGRSYRDFRVGPGASDAAPIIASLAAFRQDPRFQAAANAEITYGADTLYWIRYFKKRTGHVLASLEAYGKAVGAPAALMQEQQANEPWLMP